MEMVALLGWVDGFGADTQVKGIFYSVEEAQEYAHLDGDERDRFQYFKTGKVVYFDWYDANDFPPRNKKKKKSKKKG